MEITIHSIVSDIVRYNHKTAQVFENKQINFCCGGDKSLDQACIEANVDITELIPQLNMLLGPDNKDSKYIENLSLDALCDYIEQRYHTYIDENLAFLYEKISKLSDSHGNKHQEVFGIKALFEDVAEQLRSHMKNEEIMLFPYIRKMIKAKNENSELLNPLIEDFEDFLQTSKIIHLSETNLFKKISEMSNNYTKPQGGCNTFEVTYRTLEDFDSDLQSYIRLENNVLYPKALKLKHQLFKN